MHKKQGCLTLHVSLLGQLIYGSEGRIQYSIKNIDKSYSSNSEIPQFQKEFLEFCKIPLFKDRPLDEPLLRGGA